LAFADNNLPSHWCASCTADAVPAETKKGSAHEQASKQAKKKMRLAALLLLLLLLQSLIQLIQTQLFDSLIGNRQVIACGRLCLGGVGPDAFAFLRAGQNDRLVLDLLGDVGSVFFHLFKDLLRRRHLPAGQGSILDEQVK